MSNESQTAGTSSATDPGSAAPASAPAAAPASAPAAPPAAAPAAAPAAPGSMLSDGAAPAASTPAPAVGADGKPVQGADGKPAIGADGKPVQGAPDAYVDFTMPEGIQADAEVLSEFQAYAKEKNLSQEDAQKFADMGAKVAQKTRDAFVKQIEETQAKWVNDSRSDKELGGDKLNENLALAKRARETFGSPELTQMLNESGLGNHPEIIRAFFRVGQAIGEDRLVPGGKAPATADPLAKMYPSMVKT